MPIVNSFLPAKMSNELALDLSGNVEESSEYSESSEDSFER